MKWIEAIKKVLEEEGRSMTCDEITDLIIEKGYYESTSCYSGQIMNVYTNLHTSDLFKKDNYDKDRWELVDKSGTIPHPSSKGKILPLATIRVRDIYKCATVSFVNRVKYIYSNKVAPSFEKICDRKYAFILKDIPIHFGERHRYLENNYVNDDAKEYLGLYSRTFDDNKREIILFEDVITSAASWDEEYLDNLIWKVVVHEYAHAIMDSMHNELDKLRQQDPEICKYREESLANAFALKVLEKSLGTIITHSGFDKIKEFVMRQSVEYSHGLNLYKRDDLLKMMEFWRGVKIMGN